MRPASWVLNLIVVVSGLIVGATLGVFVTRDRAAAAGTTNVYAGYGYKCERWDLPGDNWNAYNPPGSFVQGHRCWHFDQSNWPSYGALDLDKALGSGDVGGAVWWIQGASTTPATVSVRFDPLTLTSCTGVRIVVTNSGAVGAFHYLHIAGMPSGLINSTWQNWTYWPGWTQGDRYLGTVAGSQNCPYEAGHLHQGGDVAWYSDIWREMPSDSLSGSCNPAVDAARCSWSGPVFHVTW